MKHFLVVLLSMFHTICFGQASFQAGLLPSINVNQNLPGKWKLNYKLESRQILAEGTFQDDAAFRYDYVRTDLSVLASRKVGLNNSIAFGYQLIIRSAGTGHRSIQRFTIVKRAESLRIGHRIGADQTFANNQEVEFRFRYRLTLEIPLSGTTLDPKEWYLKVNNEYLNSIQDRDYDLEIRAIPYLGYVFTDNNKLEFGMDYRIDRLTSTPSRSRFWIAVNWYVSI